MNVFKFISVSLFLLQSVFANQNFSSVAKTEDGEFAYAEKHTVTYEKGLVKSVQTQYLDKNDKVFATLTSRFSDNPYLPDSDFLDKRNNYFEETRLKGDQYIVKTGYKNKSSSTKSKSLDVKKNMVSGQGFHNFVVTNYNSLKKETEINFVVPSMRTDFSFDVSEVDIKKEDQSKFRLKISSWLLSLIASEIVVTYDDKDKKLLVYNGLTNLKDEDGDQYNALIKYNY